MFESQLKRMITIVFRIFTSMCSYEFLSFCCRLIWIVILIIIVGIDFVLFWIVIELDGSFEDKKYVILFLAASAPVFAIGACIVNFDRNNNLFSKNTSTEDLLCVQNLSLAWNCPFSKIQIKCKILHNRIIKCLHHSWLWKSRYKNVLLWMYYWHPKS